MTSPLTALDISNNHFGHWDTTAVSTQLAVAVRETPTLTALNVAHNSLCGPRRKGLATSALEDAEAAAAMAGGAEGRAAGGGGGGEGSGGEGEGSGSDGDSGSGSSDDDGSSSDDDSSDGDSDDSGGSLDDSGMSGVDMVNQSSLIGDNTYETEARERETRETRDGNTRFATAV